MKSFVYLHRVRFLFFVSFLILVGGLVNVQIIQGNELKTQAQQQVFSKRYLQPSRGLFYDRNGVSLVQNVTVYDLVLQKEVSEDLVKNIANLYNSLDLPYPFIPNSTQPNQSIVVGIDPKDIEIVYELVDSFEEELVLLSRSQRKYEYPYEFAHILGYTGKVDEQTLQDDDYYTLTDTVGKYKLEQSLEQNLRGIKYVESFNEGVSYLTEGYPGDDVVLTINSEWQRSLYYHIQKYLEDTGSPSGAGVIIDVDTGEVLSLVSVPTFDSNMFSSYIEESSLTSLETNPSLPLLDKSIAVANEPGSTFKLVTAYSLLQNNVIDETVTTYSNRCMYLGTLPFCEYGQFFYGWMNIERAIYKSSNIFFCTHLLSLAETQSINQFVSDARSFGIGSKTGIDLPGEVAGNMDSPEYKREVFDLGWFAGDTCNAAIGQGSIIVTPLQMAMVVASIENNGNYMKPHVVKQINSFKGTSTTDAKVIRTIPLDDKTKELIENGMTGVAQNPEGTVFTFLNDLAGNIRAKTGSAETFDNDGNPQTHGWVIGSFEFEEDRYAVSVYVEYGGGGYYVTPILRDFIGCLHHDFADGCM